jgi:hypothetical protein
MAGPDFAVRVAGLSPLADFTRQHMRPERLAGGRVGDQLDQPAEVVGVRRDSPSERDLLFR